MHSIQTKQILNASLSDVWKFISTPENLKLITPDYMDFTILNKEKTGEMYEGQIIEYTVKPIFSIPVRWITEITQVRQPDYFVDEQRFGPYKFWHHKHFLKEYKNGVIMEDLIHYSLSLGPVGVALNNIYIHRQLKAIFDFRAKKLNEIFNSENIMQINSGNHIGIKGKAV